MEREEEMTRNFLRQALTSASLALLAGNAVAQESVVEHCRNTSSEGDRIACLEAALLGKEAAATANTASAAPTEPAAQVDPPSMELEAGHAEDNLKPAGIGAEQVIARNESQEERIEKLEKAYGLPVARYDTVPYKKLQITLENGQVWRQISGDTQIIRVDLRRNQTVDIEESSLSGYKLRLNEMRRIVRVERVK